MMFVCMEFLSSVIFETNKSIRDPAFFELLIDDSLSACTNPSDTLSYDLQTLFD